MRALRTSIQGLGALTLSAASFVRMLFSVFVRTEVLVLRGRWKSADLVTQMFEIGNRSVLFVMVTLGFLGMVLVFQTCLQAGRVTGDLSFVGAEFIKILVHEFGPTLTAMMLATRVGAGIAAEVGSMVVTEQVDALRMSGVDPVEHLIVPRFLACCLMTAVLAILGSVVALGLGALTAWTSFQVNPRVFLNAQRVMSGDLLVGLIKSLAYGAAVPLVAGTCGLAARGGSEGVGSATTRAVIGSSFAVILLDFLLSAFGYFFLQAETGA
ncbi:MAG: ABC transporter permease [Deltaproteobacteria bacterium]|nr:ABC transporter permease [Deltaproteobacteria bacterium]